MGTRKPNSKQFHSGPIAIICEGKETEHPYFEAVVNEAKQKGLNLQVKILSDKLKDDKGKRGDSIALKEDSSDTFGEGKRYLYYEKFETDRAKYELYKQQPIRYIREAQMFLNDGCEEAWAVFDYDVQEGKADDKAHKAAFIIQDQDTNREHNKPNERLHIAFSSYSFEEWLLLHFERPLKAFNNSMCDNYKDSLKKHEKDKRTLVGCSCNECLAGYLNSNALIKDYGKDKANEYFENYTKPHLHKACVNAAWMRSIKPEKLPYKCNPYTDVDRLVMRLLDKNWDINWPKIGDSFLLGKEQYKIVCSAKRVAIRHEGSNPTLISANDIFWCDESNDYKKITSACNKTNINFKQGNEVFLNNKPAGKAILCIKSDNQEFYFEID